MKKKEVQFVEIQSQLGGECRVRNPWGDGDVAFHRRENKAETLSGSPFKFNTQKGETIVIVRPGMTPGQFRQSVPAPNGQ